MRELQLAAISTFCVLLGGWLALRSSVVSFPKTKDRFAYRRPMMALLTLLAMTLIWGLQLVCLVEIASGVERFGESSPTALFCGWLVLALFYGVARAWQSLLLHFGGLLFALFYISSVLVASGHVTGEFAVYLVLFGCGVGGIVSGPLALCYVMVERISNFRKCDLPKCPTTKCEVADY